MLRVHPHTCDGATTIKLFILEYVQNFSEKRGTTTDISACMYSQVLTGSVAATGPRTRQASNSQQAQKKGYPVEDSP